MAPAAAYSHFSQAYDLMESTFSHANAQSASFVGHDPSYLIAFARVAAARGHLEFASGVLLGALQNRGVVLARAASEFLRMITALRESEAGV